MDNKPEKKQNIFTIKSTPPYLRITDTRHFKNIFKGCTRKTEAKFNVLQW